MTPEERWQKIENGMQFLVQQQVRAEAQHKAEMEQMRGILRRAIRLGVQEARNERRKRREEDERLQREMDELKAIQKVTEQKLQAFIDSLKRSGNGHPSA